MCLWDNLELRARQKGVNLKLDEPVLNVYEVEHGSQVQEYLLRAQLFVQYYSMPELSEQAHARARELIAELLYEEFQTPLKELLKAIEEEDYRKALECFFKVKSLTVAREGCKRHG